MTILIVEDNPMILKALRYAFSDTVYDIECAKDGLKAKELYDKYKPSIVISALFLPYLNGLELIEHIRQTENEPTKILILTNNGEDDNICRAFDLGVDDYILKPFSSTDLIKKVNRLQRNNINCI